MSRSLLDVSVRTTLTLDDDVAHLVAEEARSSRRPYRLVVNEALRAGLRSRASSPSPFVVTPRYMGLHPGFDTDDVEGLLDGIEGADRR